MGGGLGSGSGSGSGSGRGQIRLNLTPEDKEAITRFKNLGNFLWNVLFFRDIISKEYGTWFLVCS